MSLVSFNREGLPSALSLNFTIYEKGHPLFKMCFHKLVDCVKSVQIRSFFWSVFFRIRTEYGEIRSISPYSVRMRENTDQKQLRIWTLFTQW